MGSQVEIARIVVNFGGFSISETGRAYEIQISQDDTFANYLVIGSEVENKTLIMGYSADPITGRYVRLFCTTAGADTGITSPSVYEIDVYGASEQNSRIDRPRFCQIPATLAKSRRSGKYTISVVGTCIHSFRLDLFLGMIRGGIVRMERRVFGYIETTEAEPKFRCDYNRNRMSE